MPGKSNAESLKEILAACIAELLAELECKAVRIHGEHAPLALPESLTAFNGFGSKELRGSITMLGSIPFFSRTHPLPTSVSPRDLADWACELANLTAGRYRNRLLTYDVSLSLGVPQSALGENVRLSAGLHHRHHPIRFAIDDSVLETWLELAIRPGFRLRDHPSESAAATLREGAMLFF